MFPYFLKKFLWPFHFPWNFKNIFPHIHYFVFLKICIVKLLCFVIVIGKKSVDDFQSKFQAIFTNISIFVHFIYSFDRLQIPSIITNSSKFPHWKNMIPFFQTFQCCWKPVLSSNMGLLWLISEHMYLEGNLADLWSQHSNVFTKLGRNSDLFLY